MEKELESYLNQVRAEIRDTKFPSCTMDSGNWKEPKTEFEMESYLSRGNKLPTPKMR